MKLHERNNNSDINGTKTSKSETSKYEQLDLVASLNVFTTDSKGNKNIIHKRTWKINENDLQDDARTHSFYMEHAKHSGKGKTLEKFSILKILI